MHLSPDALNPTTVLAASITGTLAFGAACFFARRTLSQAKLPFFLGMTGLVFLAQMIDIPTGFGFSSHLLGGLLLAALFGPFSAMLGMGLVLGAQVVFLGDGTWSTLGANYLNMGVLAVLSGYSVFRLLGGHRSAGLDLIQLAVFGLSAVASVAVSAAFASVMIGYGLGLISVAYLFSGLLEVGLFAIVSAVCLRRREFYSSPARPPKFLPLAGLCLFALFLVPLSSEQPDGLESAYAKKVAALD